MGGTFRPSARSMSAHPSSFLRMTQSPLAGVATAKRLWAAQAGLSVDERGYLSDVAQNLFGGLSDEVRAAFEQADGAELKDRKGGPAKMRSVISSSALAVNVFQHWALNDPAPVGRALGLSAAVTKIGFERRMPTGAGGTPPNLDVVLTTADGGIVGIESKFTEWMSRKTGQASSMAPYFRKPESLWGRAGLTECDRLAREINDGTKAYEYLDAPQLLKHILGLQNSRAQSWALSYVWYDAKGDTGDKHRAELAEFGERIRADLTFVAVPYQELVARLTTAHGGEPDYFAYLSQRYALGAN
jgi:hypothetical protein